MKHKFFEAMDEIKAEEQLKQDTLAFLQDKAYTRKKKQYGRLIAVFASLALVLFAGLFSYNLYFTEAAYIDIDVNPSIELTLNRFDRVIGVYAYNDDGQRVLDAVDIRHKSYREAISMLLNRMDEMGYARKDAQVTVTLEEENDASQLLEQLNAILQETAMREGAYIVDTDTKTCAHEQNLTPAKYLAILELQSYDATATFDNCRNHSLREIKEEIHAHANGQQGNHGNGSEGHGSGNGGGEGPSEGHGSGESHGNETNDGHRNETSGDGGSHGSTENGNGANHGNESNGGSHGSGNAAKNQSSPNEGHATEPTESGHKGKHKDGH